MSNKSKFVSDEMSEEEQLDLEVAAKRKEKKKKTKEEKSKDRRIIFWMMVVVMIVTLGFWLKAYFEGRINTGEINEKNSKVEEKREIEEKGFFVKYKI